MWFSRLAQPAFSAWTAARKPLRLPHKERAAGDGAAKALACYGLFLPEGERMLLRFVAGRPVSSVTCSFLDWLARSLAAGGARVLVLFWDNASWHVSKEVRGWIRRHNRAAKNAGGVRLLVCPLPKRSPWLNRIEPKWVHGKRAVCEPERVLPPREMAERICRHYGCEHLEPLKQGL